MPAHEEQVKDEDGQTEAIMIVRPHNAAKTLSLQLWRRIEGNSNFTRKRLAASTDLIGIAVDQTYHSLGRDQYVALIDIPDGMAAAMNRIESNGAIHRRLNKECPVGGRKLLLAVSRTVESMDLLMAGHARHQDAHKRAVRHLLQSGCWPRGNC